MADYQYIKGAISCSNDTEYTGSFCRLEALSPKDAVRQTSGSTYPIANIGFGRLSNPEQQDPDYKTGEIVLLAGQAVEGPIMRFKTGTGGDNEGLIAYISI